MYIYIWKLGCNSNWVSESATNVPFKASQMCHLRRSRRRIAASRWMGGLVWERPRILVRSWWVGGAAHKTFTRSGWQGVAGPRAPNIRHFHHHVHQHHDYYHYHNQSSSLLLSWSSFYMTTEWLTDMLITNKIRVDGNITIIISLRSLWSSWLDHHNHFKRVGSQHTVYYVLGGTATGWQGVEGARMMILQNHDG